jgi:hypothetical protein
MVKGSADFCLVVQPISIVSMARVSIFLMSNFLSLENVQGLARR